MKIERKLTAEEKVMVEEGRHLFATEDMSISAIDANVADRMQSEFDVIAALYEHEKLDSALDLRPPTTCRAAFSAREPSALSPELWIPVHRAALCTHELSTQMFDNNQVDKNQATPKSSDKKERKVEARFIIYQKSGVNVGLLSGHPNDILLSPRTRFKILDSQHFGDHVNIVMREIDE